MPILNIHPLIVHTPIGLLSLYTLLEIISVRRLRALSYWFFVKGVLAIVGASGAWAAYFSGSVLKQQFTSPLLEKHAFFATTTLVIFNVIAFGYLVTWISPWFFSKVTNGRSRQIWQKIEIIARFLQHRFMAIFLALLGLMSLTITGALGGALVYGADIDPIVSIIYHWLLPS